MKKANIIKKNEKEKTINKLLIVTAFNMFFSLFLFIIYRNYTVMVMSFAFSVIFTITLALGLGFTVVSYKKDKDKAIKHSIFSVSFQIVASVIGWYIQKKLILNYDVISPQSTAILTSIKACHMVSIGVGIAFLLLYYARKIKKDVYFYFGISFFILSLSTLIVYVYGQQSIRILFILIFVQIISIFSYYGLKYLRKGSKKS